MQHPKSVTAACNVLCSAEVFMDNKANINHLLDCSHAGGTSEKKYFYTQMHANSPILYTVSEEKD